MSRKASNSELRSERYVAAFEDSFSEKGLSPGKISQQGSFEHFPFPIRKNNTINKQIIYRQLSEKNKLFTRNIDVFVQPQSCIVSI